jgi:hypothetical protein
LRVGAVQLQEQQIRGATIQADNNVRKHPHDGLVNNFCSGKWMAISALNFFWLTDLHDLQGIPAGLSFWTRLCMGRIFLHATLLLIGEGTTLENQNCVPNMHEGCG